MDPGPTPGIAAAFTYPDGFRGLRVLQCNADALLPWLLDSFTPGGPSGPVLLATERFVVGTRAARSAHPAAGELTRNMIGQLEFYTRNRGLIFVSRAAGDVKPFCTDRRLRAAGLYAPTEGMRHARSACWHLLHAAVHRRLVPDPLSSAWRTS